MDLHIKIDNLKVTEVTATSGIFSGENYHSNWSAMSKSNTGLDLGGDSSLSNGCINIVYDPDLINMIRTPIEILKNDEKRVKADDF